MPAGPARPPRAIAPADAGSRRAAFFGRPVATSGLVGVDPVAAVLLGRVEGAVSEAEAGVEPVGAGDFGDAERDRQRQRLLAERQRLLGDALPDFLAEPRRLGEIGSGKRMANSSPPTRASRLKPRAARLCSLRATAARALSPPSWPWRSFRSLEMVDVEDCHRDRHAELARLTEQLLTPFEEMAAVVEAGEIVARSQVLELLELGQRLDIGGDAALQLFEHEGARDEIVRAGLEEACRGLPVGRGGDADDPTSGCLRRMRRARSKPSMSGM